MNLPQVQVYTVNISLISGQSVISFGPSGPIPKGDY